MKTPGMAGGVLAALDSFRPSLVARSTGHQAMLLAASATLGYAIGHGSTMLPALVGVRPRGSVSPWVGAGALAAVTAAAIPVIIDRADQEREAHADWNAPPMRPGVAIVQGTAGATGLVLGGHLVGALVRGGSRSASERFGGPAQVYAGGAALAGAGALRLAYSQGRRRMLDRLSVGGSSPDIAFALPPTSPLVSGGPGSLVPYPSHAREGSRLVHLACTVDEIEGVTGHPAQAPIRVFVGVAAASSPAERVALAVAELERLGAFSRGHLLVASPAGTGYVNPVPAETLEMLSGGDCATVSVQYGVLPSMLSAPALPDAALTYRLLIDAVVGRGPRVLAYGESLGAQAAQMALRAEPSRWRSDGSFEGLDGVLFVGTPAGTGIRRECADRSAVFVADQWQDLNGASLDSKRVFLLDHDADPVTRFERSLLWARPDWLSSEPRGRGVPEQMAWRPLLTYLQVLFDVARATQPQLGQFQSHGHDYRADLARLIRAAYFPSDPDLQLDAVDAELMRMELRRAELLAQT